MPSKANKNKKSRTRGRKSSHAVECSRKLATDLPIKAGGLILSRTLIPDIGMSPPSAIRYDLQDMANRENTKYETETITTTNTTDTTMTTECVHPAEESWHILDDIERESGKENEDIIENSLNGFSSDDTWVVLDNIQNGSTC